MRWIAVVFSLLASPVLSLSCSPPDPIENYKSIEASSAPWGVAVGQLSFNMGKLPTERFKDPNRMPEKTRIRAQFVGHSLDANGFKTPFQANVTLEVQCILSWCGMPTSGTRYLAYIKHEGGKRKVFAEPCGANLFPNPSNRTLNKVHSCFVGGRC